MDEMTLGMDFNKMPFRTVITIRIGMRGGKTYLMRWWLQLYHPDLLSRELIRRLAAEAVINVSITS